MGTFFFVGGAAFGHFFLFPITFRFLGQFGGQDMQFLPKIDEYYSFYSWFLLGLGVVFQVPVVVFVLARIGLVTPGFLLRKFKFAVLGAFVVCMFGLMLVVLLIWVERKLYARIQDRLGPNRVGPWGILQTIPDIVKIFTQRTPYSKKNQNFWHSVPVFWPTHLHKSRPQ